MTEAPALFPQAPYRLRNTVTGQVMSGPPIKSARGGLAALGRYMMQHPKADPVVVDTAERPVSAATLRGLAVWELVRKAGAA